MTTQPVVMIFDEDADINRPWLAEVFYQWNQMTLSICREIFARFL